MKNLPTLLFIFFLKTQLFSQSYTWLKTFDTSPGNKTVLQILPDSSGGAFALVNMADELNVLKINALGELVWRTALPTNETVNILNDQSKMFFGNAGSVLVAADTGPIQIFELRADDGFLMFSHSNAEPGGHIGKSPNGYVFPRCYPLRLVQADFTGYKLAETPLQLPFVQTICDEDFTSLLPLNNGNHILVLPAKILVNGSETFRNAFVQINNFATVLNAVAMPDFGVTNAMRGAIFPNNDLVFTRNQGFSKVEILKYQIGGTKVFQKSVQYSYSKMGGISSANDNRTLITGKARNPNGQATDPIRLWILEMDELGNPLRERFYAPNSTANAEGNAIAFTSDGHWLAGGTTRESANEDPKLLFVKGDVVVSEKEQTVENHLLASVSPNPVIDKTTFEWSKPVFRETFFKLREASGREVFASKFDGQRFDFFRGGLPNGLYFFEMILESGGVFSGKVVFH